jgi:hypothetical protein
MLRKLSYKRSRPDPCSNYVEIAALKQGQKMFLVTVLQKENKEEGGGKRRRRRTGGLEEKGKWKEEE